MRPQVKKALDAVEGLVKEFEAERAAKTNEGKVQRPVPCRENVVELRDKLIRAFPWEMTPQGTDYWHEVWKQLGKLI